MFKQFSHPWLSAHVACSLLVIAALVQAVRGQRARKTEAA